LCNHLLAQAIGEAIRPRKSVSLCRGDRLSSAQIRRRRILGDRHSATVVRAALEPAGVIFVDENGDGPGVRLRKGGAAATKPASIPIEDLCAENDG
jgi:hypothetical protein